MTKYNSFIMEQLIAGILCCHITRADHAIIRNQDCHCQMCKIFFILSQKRSNPLILTT